MSSKQACKKSLQSDSMKNSTHTEIYLNCIVQGSYKKIKMYPEEKTANSL